MAENINSDAERSENPTPENPINSEDKNSEWEAPHKFCTRCGRRLAFDAAYCDGCGHAQSAKKAADDVRFVGRKTYSDEKINDIIGKEKDYYSRKFAELRESDSHICWNWYACLGWNWYAYRKMPVEALICFGLWILFGFFDSASFVLRLGLLAVSGALGNYIYMKHIERTIDKIEALPSSMREASVKEHSGVSGQFLVAAFLISGLFGVIVPFTAYFIKAAFRLFHRIFYMIFGI